MAFSQADFDRSTATIARSAAHELAATLNYPDGLADGQDRGHGHAQSARNALHVQRRERSQADHAVRIEPHERRNLITARRVAGPHASSRVAELWPTAFSRCWMASTFMGVLRI